MNRWVGVVRRNFFLLILALVAASSSWAAEDDAFLNQIEVRALRYFEENTHPVTGLVLTQLAMRHNRVFR